jgi:hypothetical protein
VRATGVRETSEHTTPRPRLHLRLETTIETTSHKLTITYKLYRVLIKAPPRYFYYTCGNVTYGYTYIALATRRTTHRTLTPHGRSCKVQCGDQCRLSHVSELAASPRSWTDHTAGIPHMNSCCVVPMVPPFPPPSRIALCLRLPKQYPHSVNGRWPLHRPLVSCYVSDIRA